jgi:hypothetical protein
MRPTAMGLALGLALARALPAAPPVALWPAGAAALAPMSGPEFRAFAEGWTLHFESGGAPYGAETYLPGGKVIWKPEGQACGWGSWAERDGRICFRYDEQMACWKVYRDAKGVLARSAADGFEVRVSRRDRAPLACGEVPAV